jgi:hypothetical protein
MDYSINNLSLSAIRQIVRFSGFGFNGFQNVVVK